jgi:hypothetical protein
MKRLSGLMAGLASCLAIGGCAEQRHNVIMMDGKADGVVIQYYGDVEATLPLAREHCAAYERNPLRRSYSAEKNLVIYACVPR